MTDAVAAPHHHERHFTGSEVLRDSVIGMADGLTVPFALAAGSIAMGLGGYLAARGQAEHYASERRREQTEVHEKPAAEEAEITAIFADYGIKPEESAAVVSAATIGGAYVVGGLIPLVPYMLLASARTALLVSAVVTLLALAVFGYVKGRFTGLRPVRSAVQTLLIGSIAAAFAYVLARLLG